MELKENKHTKMNKKTEVNVEEDEEKGTKTKEFTFHIVFCVVGLYKGT